MAGVVPGSSAWVAQAGLVALLVGAMLLAARLLRLGFLSNFLPRSVLTGFLAGVGLSVAASQLPDVLGLPPVSGGFLPTLIHVLQSLGEVVPATALVAAVVIAGTVILERLAPRLPAPLLAAVGGIAVALVVDLPARGVALVGAVPGGLPGLGLPSAGLGDAPGLLATAAGIFIVVIAQSAATSRSFAARHGHDVDENADLVGLGVASLAAGLTGTFPVNGSPTKSAVVDQAGGRSQWRCWSWPASPSSSSSSPGPLLARLPVPVLAAIVTVVALRLIDRHTFLAVARVRPDEALVAGLTAVTVVLVGVEAGIIVAVVLSIVDHVRRNYQPSDAVITHRDGQWETERPVAGARSEPGMVAYRFGASLFYANADLFDTEVRELVRGGSPPVRCLVLDAAAINDVDYSAAEMLRQLLPALQQAGVRLYPARVQPSVLALLQRYGLGPLLPQHLYDSLAGAYEAARQAAAADLATGDAASGVSGGTPPGAAAGDAAGSRAPPSPAPGRP